MSDLATIPVSHLLLLIRCPPAPPPYEPLPRRSRSPTKQGTDAHEPLESICRHI
ncbi:hypothetical protein L227DRAFT_573293 [Lentinus tigrinus ALCF2SS1-6]|uniref:Uncharacterized protein n=1 Tax=Lentinus tigrinus ALCF2SS1-6 TaxID=1328759 RepID=A0A5C2SMQ8_9APHY|nr:hypothetical protein L227DRAFT_573293 [Lentinus tigrinus ALCF2SS1-6]